MTPELDAVIDACVRAALAAIDERIAGLEARVLTLAAPSAIDEAPEPLADILGISPAAARRREERDVALRALAVGYRGRRRVYLASAVRGHLAAVPRGGARFAAAGGER